MSETKKPRVSGRKKGTPNRCLAPLKERARKFGVDPFDLLLHVCAQNWKALGYKSDMMEVRNTVGGIVEVERINLDQRIQAAKEACKYLYPTLKAIDHTVGGVDGNPIKHEVKLFTEEQITAMAQAMLIDVPKKR